MKNHSLLFFLLIFGISRADINVKLYYEPNEEGYTIYADNLEHCPVTIKLSFSLKNLKNTGTENITVVPARNTNHVLTKLKIINTQKKYSFTYQYWSNFGDSNITSYDEDYLYHLPFKTSSTFKVNQGYNGSTSHKGKNAIDFTMPIGTEITAVRGGKVIKVVEENNKNCNEKKCAKYNNKIIIYHADGTFASYLHLRKNGAIVKVGDSVTTGQLIGYSGNVGWSSGPHLHLEIFRQKREDLETLRTKFKIDDGTTASYLKEQERYTRKY